MVELKVIFSPQEMVVNALFQSVYGRIERNARYIKITLTGRFQSVYGRIERNMDCLKLQSLRKFQSVYGRIESATTTP